MMQKLRRKFILVNMLLVSLVLLAVFGVLLGSTAQRQKSQSLGAMRLALKWSDEAPPPPFEIGQRFPNPDGGRDHDRQSAIVPIFCVTLDGDGSVVSVTSGNNVTVSDELLQSAVTQALASGRSDGVLSRLGLRFLVETSPEGVTRVAFADRSGERDTITSLILTSLLVGLGALAGFFLISLFLSSLALRPAERAWQQQRQFVADASHELKTPLTVILANSGIVLSHRDDLVAQQAKWVEYTQEEAKRMKELVDDLLFLAKSDDARRAARPAQVQISDLAMGCLLPFESVAFEAGVTLESRITEGLTVCGDEAQLRRLVMILLDNACKYAGKGGAVLLSLTQQQEKIRLSVHNTGAPIPAEHLPHLFERFYRVDSARGRSEGGYGLGLAIAKSIVDGHRGKLSVTSTAEAGTVFTAVLPRK